MSLYQIKREHCYMQKFCILIWETDTWMYTNVNVRLAVHLRFVSLTICKLRVNKKVNKVSGIEFAYNNEKLKLTNDMKSI